MIEILSGMSVGERLVLVVLGMGTLFAASFVASIGWHIAKYWLYRHYGK